MTFSYILRSCLNAGIHTTSKRARVWIRVISQQIGPFRKTELNRFSKFTSRVYFVTCSPRSKITLSLYLGRVTIRITFQPKQKEDTINNYIRDNIGELGLCWTKCRYGHLSYNWQAVSKFPKRLPATVPKLSVIYSWIIIFRILLKYIISIFSLPMNFQITKLWTFEYFPYTPPYHFCLDKLYALCSFPFSTFKLILPHK